MVFTGRTSGGRAGEADRQGLMMDASRKEGGRTGGRGTQRKREEGLTIRERKIERKMGRERIRT